MKKKVLILVFVLFGTVANAQILISLLFGDKLNSDKLEFGMDGGLNFSSLNGLDPSGNALGINLGFYFDIDVLKKNRNLLLHTGLIVKSPMGAKGLPVYSLNDSHLDEAFAGGTVSRKLQYFSVPILLKYKIKNWYLEGGPQLGLMNKAIDEFTNKVIDKKDLIYKLNIRKNFHPIDAGLTAGIGYRLLKGNGMNLGIRYYYGLLNMNKVETAPDQFNRSLYFVIGIPIGVAKTAK